MFGKLCGYMQVQIKNEQWSTPLEDVLSNVLQFFKFCQVENETQDVDDSIPLRDLLAQSVNTTDDATEKIKGDQDNSSVTTKLDHSMETGGESFEHEESALNFSLRISDDEDVIRQKNCLNIY